MSTASARGPYEPTSFIGRSTALTELEDLLTHRRLLTLTGPPGVGKTRLALRLTADCLDQFPDGTVLVELPQHPGLERE